jgi:hypothetical protein
MSASSTSDGETLAKALLAARLLTAAAVVKPRRGG